MKYEKNHFVQLRVISGKTYAVHNNDVYLFDEVEEAIWKLIDSDTTEEQIATIMSNKYQVPFEEVHQDVREYLTELFHANMIEKVN
ncbi:MAG: PqqD family protein [Paenibacillus macerans]|uniref:PqqD family protein n=1 Tax=Paenibacillus TaxID=44249 RepID=UPI000ED7C81A|nr:PqqD family protein [Paenibacillus macerans]MDU7472514.1 PqqD family protein [Paenibacillus macerans]MEC0136895.1 PqqD family protein [Paenibacillus macerans]UMV49866.1 PqqD family protein [Paenibacillus macerans]GBK61213.1 PqqD family protein [Paenibacillus macerans]GBK67515.1 PqqD family protein [Paenibacillus macerans]